ncbi:MAG: tetratricopeptide repeat protein [bacterium]|nr:tetratricopeptide repeat protein [bacterium]
MPQIGIAVDYVHLMGLVHCDLKLENFLIRVEGPSPEIVLVDLDFLCHENSDPEGRVFGTPDHIAPEIVANDRIVIQSDMFSLGVSLADWLSRIATTSSAGGPSNIVADERMGQLVKKLTSTDHLRRPRYLLEALHRYHLIDLSNFESSQKTLLAMALVTGYRTGGPAGLDSRRGLDRFLHKDHKILGLGDEFIISLAGAFAIDRRKTFGIVKQVLRDAKVERHADYWHLDLDDESKLRLYDGFERMGGGGEPNPGSVSEGDRSTREIIEEVHRLVEQGQSEYAYLRLKEYRASSGESRDAIDDEALLSELASLARTLNRLVEQNSYLEPLYELKEKLGKSGLETLYERVRANALMGRYDIVVKLTEAGLQLVTDTVDMRLEVGLLRMRAWVHQNRGEYDEALSILDRILSLARKHELIDQVVLILYNIGVLYWRRGDFPQSEKFLLESYELAEREDQLTHAIPVISILAGLAFEQADYARSIKYGKLAVKIAIAPEQRSSLPAVCSNIADAHIRLADFPKAEYWQQRYLSLVPVRGSKNYLLSFYLQEGYLEFNRGNLAAARDSWHKARGLLEQGSTSRNAGKVYYNLAEAALYQGDFSICAEYLAKARTIVLENDDEASLAEIDLASALRDLYAGEKRDIARLPGITASLIDKNCRYYAVLGVFHSLLHSPEGRLEDTIRVTSALTGVLQDSRTPLFRAVSCILDAFEQAQGKKSLSVTTWKKVFAVLLGSRQNFLALLVGIKIAGLYRSSSNSKHAKKFLLQSLRLAEGLGNAPMVRSIQADLERVSQSADSSARLIDSFHGISEILTNLEDYRQSLQRLIKFAVDQTGAERGVIFLKARDGTDLTVAASLNCDDQSLSDIRDFSMNVPYATMKELSPLIIENALADQRTNRYESIVCHNILSVICVPLSTGDESLGALYLDHHTIPALFDNEDLTFISSVANFISVTLSTARDFRSQVLTNVQMRRDLGRLGNKQTFVTQDSNLLSLFKTLPQVAATSAPVLILGESGTGKEILGEMIHEYSPRADKPLVKLNCAAIAGSLIESELFGVARNTATSVGEREGRFSAADGGTLYLDEIGDMPPEVQSKVLRVLEYQQFEKVGSNHPVHTDIRFVYATNKDLPELVADKEFRQDLYYRINTITIEIPPLRDRPGDVPILVEHFVMIFSEGKAAPRFATSAVEALVAYNWPGNVRELKNLVERYCILHPGSAVTKEMLPSELCGGPSVTRGQRKALDAHEAERIVSALAALRWNQSRAAARLGMPITTLRRKMKKHGIHRPH